MIKITITENQGNQRLDRFLKKYFDRAPLSHIYKLIRKDVKVNGKRQKEDTKMCIRDRRNYDLALDTSRLSQDECIRIVSEYIKSR